jgi:hypothetical protein
MRKALEARCLAPTTAQRDMKRARKAVQKPPYHSTLIPGTSRLLKKSFCEAAGV